MVILFILMKNQMADSLCCNYSALPIFVLLIHNYHFGGRHRKSESVKIGEKTGKENGHFKQKKP